MPTVDFPSSTGPISLSIETINAEGLTVVSLSGELDLSTASQLRERLVEFSGNADANMLLSLGGLTFLDSTGISVMVMACKRIRSEGGFFSVTDAHGEVRRILEVTGVFEYLEAPTS